MYNPGYKNKMQPHNMLSVREYSLKRGISCRAVQLAIKNGWKMEGVEKVETVGGRSVIFMKTEGET